jgi:hypothetical protein
MYAIGSILRPTSGTEHLKLFARNNLNMKKGSNYGD